MGCARVGSGVAVVLAPSCSPFCGAFTVLRSFVFIGVGCCCSVVGIVSVFIIVIVIVVVIGVTECVVVVVVFLFDNYNLWFDLRLVEEEPWVWWRCVRSLGQSESIGGRLNYEAVCLSVSHQFGGFVLFDGSEVVDGKNIGGGVPWEGVVSVVFRLVNRVIRPSLHNEPALLN